MKEKEYCINICELIELLKEHQKEGNTAILKDKLLDFFDNNKKEILCGDSSNGFICRE